MDFNKNKAAKLTTKLQQNRFSKYISFLSKLADYNQLSNFSDNYNYYQRRD